MNIKRLYQLEKNHSLDLYSSSGFKFQNHENKGVFALPTHLMPVLGLFRFARLPLEVLAELKDLGDEWEEVSEEEFVKLVDGLCAKGILKELPVEMASPVYPNLSLTVDVSSWGDSDFRIRRAALPPELDEQCIKIGKFCCIAKGVQFFVGGVHRTNHVCTYPLLTKYGALDENMKSLKEYPEAIVGDVFDKIEIGHDVWVGGGATFMGGVTVGHGAVVGANSHVVSDVPPYAIVLGNPAQVVRYRFPKNVVKELLRIEWWNWDEGTIKERARDFYQGMDHFLSKYGTGVLQDAKPVLKEDEADDGADAWAEKIRQFIEGKISAKKKIEKETNLLDAGTLSSLLFFELLGFIEKEFLISVPIDDVLPENFSTISKITSYLRQKK